MLLADSIKAWGRAHRSELDDAAFRELGEAWRIIKDSPYAELDLREMGKDDARAIMALFEPDQRAAVSSSLNSVRKWALAQGAPADPAPPTAATTTPAPTAEPPSPDGQIPISPPSPYDLAHPPDPTPVRPVARPGAIETVRISASDAAQMPVVEVDPSTPPPRDPLNRGPVEGWQPPVGADGGKGSNTPVLLGAAAFLIVLFLVWLLFLRGDDDASDPVLATTDGSTTTAPTDSTGTSGTTGTSDSTTTDGTQPSFDGSGSGDFCALAQQFNEADPFIDGVPGPQTFATAVALIDQVTAVAPDEIRNDFITIGSVFRQYDQIAASFDYDFTNLEFGTQLAAVDTTEFDLATDRVDAYLLQVCGIDTSAGSTTSTTPTDSTGIPTIDDNPLGDLTDDQAEQLNQVILDSLGITPELAECLNRELGDISEASADPTLLNAPVCGTTLAQVLAGIGG